MDDDIELLFDNNRTWSQRMCEQAPAFFSRLAEQQAPRYLSGTLIPAAFAILALVANSLRM